MIISDARKEVFCHIPKNGGSSLRRYFTETWGETRAYQGRRPVAALDGATRDLTHITVAEAAAWFDDDLVGQGMRVSAVIRPPMPRFSSALLQYVRSFVAQDKHFVTADVVRAAVAETPVQELCARAAEDISCIYFRPQVDFIATVPEAQRDLIALKDLGTRFPDLPRDNPGGRLPGWMGFAKHPAIKRLAGGVGRKVKTRLGAALIRKDPEVETALNAVIAENRAWLESFYAADQALYDSLLATTAAPPSEVRAAAEPTS